MKNADAPDDIEASRAPLIEHLVELRMRLLWSLLAIAIAFVGCFYYAQEIYNFLLEPYAKATAGREDARLIFTAPQEFFFTQIRLALFGSLFIAFPVIASQIYMFVAPGLYRNERGAFFPYLLATPVLFVTGASLVYYLIMPLALSFFLTMEQSGEQGEIAIRLLPRVSEYMSLVTTLIFAFGLCFQTPVALTLLGRVGIISAQQLRKGRKYAIVITFAVAAVLTPPDPVTQIGLGLPTIALYELSILCVAFIERRRRRQEKTSPSAS